MSEVINTIQPPNWLDREFVTESLRSGMRNEDLTVQELDIKPAVAVGDNYASQMFRARLVVRQDEKGTPETLSVIMKSLPLGKFAENMDKFRMFTTETRMLSDTLPKMNRILKTKFPDHENFNARCYFHQGPPRDLIIMEDLKESGFAMGDRFNGLDLAHSTLALKNMAKLHAASLLVARDDPSLKETYAHYLWCEEFESLIAKFLQQNMKNLLEAAKTWTDMEDHENLVKKLTVVDQEILQRTYDVHKRNESALNVLLHGDSWVSNMMFRYEGGKPAGFRFVDYQLANWNSPALDVLYFVFTSVKDELRASHLQQLLQAYHETFLTTLSAFNYTLPVPFTLKDFIREFRDKLFFGFVTAATVYPITSAKPQDAPDVNDLLEGDQVATSTLFKNENLAKVMKRLLPYFNQQGVL